MKAVAGVSEWVALPPCLACSVAGRACVPHQDAGDLMHGAPAVGEVLAVLREWIRNHGMLGRRQHGWLLDGFARVTAGLPIISEAEYLALPITDAWPCVVVCDDEVLHDDGSDAIRIDLSNAKPGGVALRLERCPCPNDCERFGNRVPGHTLGSNWAWVPCPTCPRRPVSVTWHGPLGEIQSREFAHRQGVS